LAPEVLGRVLEGIDTIKSPHVLVGFETADDAGVYQLDNDTAIIQTVDFFTPVVDDAFLYGQIAAANALSDVYAMGGQPICALSILGFPVDLVEEEVLKEMIRGGTEKMNQAGVPIIGGHSIQDNEIKLGYCVTGKIRPDRILTNSAARTGDKLILTKPLGTGIITTGIKFGKTADQVARIAIETMLELNNGISLLFDEISVHAVTDITGFGLIGHAFEMATGSKKTLEIEAASVPILPGTRDLAKQKMLPGGIQSNASFVGSRALWRGGDEIQKQILLDPQTSGGLLISIDDANLESLRKLLINKNLSVFEIGRVKPLGEYSVEIV
jgi:selenide,water dikinase